MATVQQELIAEVARIISRQNKSKFEVHRDTVHIEYTATPLRVYGTVHIKLSVNAGKIYVGLEPMQGFDRSKLRFVQQNIEDDLTKAISQAVRTLLGFSVTVID